MKSRTFQRGMTICGCWSVFGRGYPFPETDNSIQSRLKAHDEYVRKVNRQREKERREADRIKALENEAKFQGTQRSLLSDFVFTDNEIEIKTLDSR